jgi:APA family basic amino acid/polyamine antiporter
VVMTLIQRPAQAWAGLGFLALGVPVFYYWKSKKA